MNLTNAEKEILILLGQGLTVKEIAIARNVSTRTVESHIYNCIKKTYQKNRVGLVIWAIKQGIIVVPDFDKVEIDKINKKLELLTLEVNKIQQELKRWRKAVRWIGKNS